MKWKDVSSFSQGDKARIPCSFELRAAGIRIAVSRHIHYAPDAWVLRCEPFTTGTEISNGTADEAMDLAVEYVLSHLDKAAAVLRHNAM